MKRKKYRNKKSERITKGRSSEPIEVRLLREGKMTQKRRQEKIKNESRPQGKRKSIRGRRRVQSSVEGAREIIRENKGTPVF